MAHENHKKQKNNEQKWQLCEAQEKKGFFNEKKTPGTFLPFINFASTPAKMLGVPSSTQMKTTKGPSPRTYPIEH